MLETLDQIDWKAIGYHVYGRNETIPENIQRLASSDPEVRVNAVDFLLGVGQDFGDLYDTTPHILPFLFELLSQEAALDPVDLLDHMAQVAKYMYDGRCRSIYMMRLGLKTYDALKAGQGVLIKMLGHSPSEVRIASAKLLQYMTDDVETLVPLIIDSFYKEPDEDVRIALLVSLKTLFSSLAWTHYRWSDQYVSFFAEVIDASPSHKVTVAAASAIVELMDRGRDKREELSEKVSAILVRDFWKRPCPMSVEERDSPYRKWMLLKDLSRLEMDPLLTMLQNSELSEEDAHLVARGVLACAFHVAATSDYWEHPPSATKRDRKINYGQPAHYQHLLNGRHRRAIGAIVDTNGVWTRPTNMFSYFYGLPDTREGLRAIAMG